MKNHKRWIRTTLGDRILLLLAFLSAVMWNTHMFAPQLNHWLVLGIAILATATLVVPVFYGSDSYKDEDK